MFSRLAEKGTQANLTPFSVIWVIALVGRLTIFSSGGVGGWVCVLAFWAATVCLLAISIQHLRNPTGKRNAKYIFIAAGLASFGLAVFGPSGIVAEISRDVWLVCLAGLLISYIYGAIQHRRSATSH